MSDLGKRLANGDDDAFNEAVDLYSRKVYAICYRILRNAEEARDMVQEVFVRVYTKRKSFKAKSSLYTWIYRIAVNLCLSHLKKHKACLIPLEDVEGKLEAHSSDEAAGKRDVEIILERALGGLPPKQRAVFVMRFYEKMSFKEIAQAMGTSVGAAKANHHFAVEHLRRALEEVR